jgi:hypothetical protein
MAIPTPVVTPGNTNVAAPVLIDRELCMGDSLQFINGNTDYFNLLTNALQLSANNANTRVTNLSSRINETLLFIPANLATRTNGIAEITYTATGTVNATPWWSGIQTINLTNVPNKAIAALVEIWFNVNALNNNGQYLSIRKDSTEPASAPSNSTVPEGITRAQMNAIIADPCKRMQIDPTGGASAAWEGDDYKTMPIYFNTTTNSFQWFIADAKDTGAPSSTPVYTVVIKILGYYVTL